MRRSPRLRFAGNLLAIATAVTAELGAQIPEEFHNLQVLSEDISRPELIATMRGFALGLGVRCHHCHVGEEGVPFSEYDFESDEKETKRKARFMLQMVQDLNNQRLPALTEIGQRAEPGVEVTCEMCHRGRPVPWMLEEVLAATVTAEGVEAAAAQYRTLRTEFYGSGSYDFGPMTLVDLAGQLVESQQTDDALVILNLQQEFHPESVQTWVALAQVHMARDERPQAVAALEKALELDPQNRFLQGQLQRLRDPEG